MELASSIPTGGAGGRKIDHPGSLSSHSPPLLGKEGIFRISAIPYFGLFNHCPLLDKEGCPKGAAHGEPRLRRRGVVYPAFSAF